MDHPPVREFLESGEPLPSSTDALPGKFYNPLIMHGVHIDLVEPGRVLCSMKVPLRLANGGSFLHGGMAASLVDIIGTAAIIATGARTTGVTIGINTSYLDNAFLDEVIEIEAKALRVGKSIGVVHVEVRKKETGKLVAQSRLTKFLHCGITATLADIIGSATIRADGVPTTGVTVGISTSYLDTAFVDEVIEIEAMTLWAATTASAVFYSFYLYLGCGPVG